MINHEIRQLPEQLLFAVCNGKHVHRLPVSGNNGEQGKMISPAANSYKLPISASPDGSGWRPTCACICTATTTWRSESPW